MSTALRVGFVVPRYGVEVFGGAEHGARQIAEHLLTVGVPVEVFTSCAIDATTWAGHFAPGEYDVNGVAVHRFAGTARHADFDFRSRAVLARPTETSLSTARRWIAEQGPFVPEALDAAEASRADAVVLYPYLYWPTVEGARRLGRRAVLQPAAHDEPPLHLPVFPNVFTRVGGLIFHSRSERRLVERVFPPTVAMPQAELGLGVDEGRGDGSEARAALGLGDRPYLICIGRVDALKGTTLLARWFAAYKERHPGPLALVLVGQPVDPPRHPDIVLTGLVDDNVKWGALRGADALVSPSAFESFSLVLLEGWLAGLPALVNGACHPTVEHCRRSGGGLWFTSYGSFEVALERLLGDAALRRSLGAAGRQYVARHFSWPVLIENYRSFLSAVAARAAGAAPSEPSTF